MKTGYRVEYDSDDQICIIPNPTIPMQDLIELTKMYGRMGYQWWIVPDRRRGYIYSKIKPEENKNEMRKM
jgi:hypothetical protein